MDMRLVVCLGAAALTLAGCGKSESGQNAAASIDSVVDNTTTSLEQTASSLPDAEQANAVVNEEAHLINAGDAAVNVAESGGNATK